MVKIKLFWNSIAWIEVMKIDLSKEDEKLVKLDILKRSKKEKNIMWLLLGILNNICVYNGIKNKTILA